MAQYTFRDSIPKSSNAGFTPRKIGLFSIPVAISMAMMYCGQKVNSILYEDKKDISTNLSSGEKSYVSENWTEAHKDQVLKIYHIKKGDTLSHIARENGVTLESILNVNPKITSADAIGVGDTIIIAHDKIENTPSKKLLTNGAPVPQSLAQHTVVKTQHASSEMTHNDDTDMRSLTMVFEGFSPRMKIDTHTKNTTTYAIGYGTNIGTLQATYPFGSYGKDVADSLREKGHSNDSIKKIMHGEENISRSEGYDLFEMRYVVRYQKLRTHCGKNWAKYPPIVRNMLVDMSYNIGEYGIFPKGNLPGFPDAVAALNRGDWAKFINEIADSKYASDVGPRRAGKWIALVVRDVLKGKTSGLSKEVIHMLSTYTTKHSKDLNAQIAKNK